jgi:hypothetical protein
MKWIASIFAVCVVTALAASANAGDGKHRYCTYKPRAEWKTAKDIVDKATREGYEVVEIKSKHGCWEIEAINASRHHVEVVYDPAGELLWIDDD